MSKKKEIIVKETTSALKLLRKKQTSLALEKRVIWLLQFKLKKNLLRENTAYKVNISLRTQERWINEYMNKANCKLSASV